MDLMKKILAFLAGILISLSAATTVRAADAAELAYFDLFSTTVLSNAVNTAGSGVINVPLTQAPVVQLTLIGTGAATNDVIFTWQASLDGAYWYSLATTTNALTGTTPKTVLNTLTKNTSYRQYRLYSITSVATNSVRLVQRVPYILTTP